MRDDKRFSHYHEKSSKWFRDHFMSYTNGSEKDRDVHHHRIIDTSSGLSGEGFGWSYQDAETKAWDDLKNRRPKKPKMADLGA